MKLLSKTHIASATPQGAPPLYLAEVQIETLDSGLIYRNPTPHLTSRHAYFPSVIQMDNGEMLASFSIGEAFEAVNLNTCISRSSDGINWSDPAPLLPPEWTHQHSNCARLTALPNGEVIAIIVQHDRSHHLNEGLANPHNLGFVPTKVLLLRSHDYGNTWDTPESIIPPLTDSPLELCSPIVPLSDGRWIWPTSTWRNWNGDCPNGLKMAALVSSDYGKTWPEYLDVMHDRAQEKIYWESKIIELNGGTLLAVAWVFDEKSNGDLPNHYCISHDGGATWTPPVSTGLQGQTMAIAELPNGDILSIYRRMDKAGLWGNISQMQNGEWINKSTFPLWGAGEMHLNGHQHNMVSQFNELKFGAPCIAPLADGSFYVAFWCYEKLVSNIRWFHL